MQILPEATVSIVRIGAIAIYDATSDARCVPAATADHLPRFRAVDLAADQQVDAQGAEITALLAKCQISGCPLTTRATLRFGGLLCRLSGGFRVVQCRVGVTRTTRSLCLTASVGSTSRTLGCSLPITAPIGRVFRFRQWVTWVTSETFTLRIAALAAGGHFIPATLPLLAPREFPIACDTHFGRQVVRIARRALTHHSGCSCGDGRHK
jgi:hypothetical protein